MPKKPTEGALMPGGSAVKKARARATREETTALILDAAEGLFATRNPNEVTVREVAKRAGVSHALVHQYVGTKDELLNAVIQRVATDRAALVKRSPSLDEAVSRLATEVLTNRVYTKTVVRSAMDGVEYVSLDGRIVTGHALIKLAGDTAASGAKPGPAPRGIDNNVLVAAISALLFGWGAIEDWVWPIFDLDPANKEDIYRQLGDILVYVADLALQPNGRPAAEK